MSFEEEVIQDITNLWMQLENIDQDVFCIQLSTESGKEDVLSDFKKLDFLGIYPEWSFYVYEHKESKSSFMTRIYCMRKRDEIK